jgi:hypothetical protein
MAADFLEMEHHLGQVLISDFMAMSHMGDGPVLTKYTAKIAVRKEDGA